ncbi:MAG: hypothetical protein ACRCVX_13215 [Shewanella sp.]
MPQLVYPSTENFDPSRHEFDLVNDGVRMLQSPFTGSVQTQETPWPRWRASLGYAGGELRYGVHTLARARLEDRRAFWAQARGMAGRVLLFNHERPVPLGTMRGSPVTNATVPIGATSFVVTAGAGQNGLTVRKGDFFGFGNNQLVRVTADAVVAAGQVTITFEPPVKASVAVNAPLIWDRPRALFRVMDTSYFAPITPGQYGDSNIELIEV